MSEIPIAVAFDDVCEALADVFAMMDEGLLVRDISKDGEPDWAVRSLQFVMRMKPKVLALSRARGEDVSAGRDALREDVK